MTTLRCTSTLTLFLLLGDIGPAYGQEAARGPLRVSKENSRYFADPSGRAVLLTGSHTWNNLVDMGRSDPPEEFDYDGYLDFLEKHGHNFIRLWAWDSTVWDMRANGSLGKDFVHHVAPLPWLRTGPGSALDGKTRFDLTKLDPAYFTRLRERVQAAGRRGIYVSVMLFEGWGLMHGNQGRESQEGWAWRSHPFNPKNNVNGIEVAGSSDLAGRVHRLQPALNELQAAYIRRVVESVNDLDNVLYEVINEGGDREWDRWVIEMVRQQERTMPKQHPIGLTGHGAEQLESMLDSSADWISPGRIDGYAEDPPAWNSQHKRVSILDTDHVWGVGGNVGWVWKSFLRGHNPIFMDPYDGSVLGSATEPNWEPIRLAMGDVRRFSKRLNLAQMQPAPQLASTGYCLTESGREYVVFVPDGGHVIVDLSAAQGVMDVEWFDPHKRKSVPAGSKVGGGRSEFQSPVGGESVLFLRVAVPSPP